MDFTLDSEQTALRDAVRGLLKGYDAEHRPRGHEERPGFDEDMWSKLAEMGILGLPFSEDDGGMGAGQVEVSVVAEEFGRVVAPSRSSRRSCLAGGLVAACGSAEQKKEILGGISSGEIVPAFAWADPTAARRASASTATRSPASRNRCSTAAGPTRSSCSPRAGCSWSTAPPPSARRTAPSTAAAPRGSGSTRPPRPRSGDGGDATEATQSVIAAAQVAYAHEALGAMDSALTLTTSYLTTRKQFGVSLNRFQSLTFRAADMYTSLELTRSIVSWATMVLADEDVSPEKKREAAARAKLQVSKAGRHIGQEAIQLHGGIGMTAEYSVGWLTARLTAIDHLLGDGRQLTTQLARGLASYGVVEPLP
jgi:alkylation response protein AidB-like acyl-CoA dehydrogenase